MPSINPFCIHSHMYNCELAFHNFVINYPELTDNPDEADWHYLPLYWSYWQLNNDYGRQNRDELKEYLNKLIIDPKKTFTVSEADGEPHFEIPMEVLTANTPNPTWKIIPEITSPHQVPKELPEKKYLASFIGSFKTHPIRPAMQKALRIKEGVFINRSEHAGAEQMFVKGVLESYATLCPRGSAMASYRFWESMQLGVCPIMVSLVDMRPFPNEIDWKSCSYWVDDVNKLPNLIDSLDKAQLVQMGKKAQEVWWSLYKDNNWCNLALKLL